MPPQPLEARNLSRDDIIIAVMGATGVGKSTFIATASQQPGRHVGHSLESHTSDIRAIRIQHPSSKRTIVLLDTPGFDDTYLSDASVLKIISFWLMKTYQRHIKLKGVVYMHRITDNRFAGTPHKNLRMFGKLVGDDAIRNVIFTTTMWSLLRNKEVGERRTQELVNKY